MPVEPPKDVTLRVLHVNDVSQVPDLALGVPVEVGLGVCAGAGMQSEDLTRLEDTVGKMVAGPTRVNGIVPGANVVHHRVAEQRASFGDSELDPLAIQAALEVGCRDLEGAAGVIRVAPPLRSLGPRLEPPAFRPSTAR
jgi:hypothetical protein